MEIAVGVDIACSQRLFPKTTVARFGKCYPRIVARFGKCRA